MCGEYRSVKVNHEKQSRKEALGLISIKHHTAKLQRQSAFLLSISTALISFPSKTNVLIFSSLNHCTELLPKAEHVVRTVSGQGLSHGAHGPGPALQPNSSYIALN